MWGHYMLWLGLRSATICGLYISNNFPNILFQSDNIHISKMIVDNSVDKCVQISRRIRSKELYPLMSNRCVCSKPSSHIGDYRYYRL